MKRIFLSISLLISCTAMFAQSVIWDESTDGDLQGDSGNDATIFQMVTLVEGVNIIRGTIGNTIFNGPDGTVDAFNFIVPTGGTITAFEISSFTLQNSNIGTYVGAYTNGMLSFGTAVSSPLSILSYFGGGTLGAGTYGISMNEVTTEGAVYEFSITYAAPPAAIPTLTQWGIIILSLLIFIIAASSINMSSKLDPIFILGNGEKRNSAVRHSK